jgi:hypothetical protein
LIYSSAKALGLKGIKEYKKGLVLNKVVIAYRVNESFFDVIE